MHCLIKDDPHIYIGDQPIKIISGAIHYFRIVPEYWEDRLTKIKQMGCNAIETYVPWNIHEPEKGTFQFEGQADLFAFLELAKKLDLYVILRASPYICAEWEFGGLPYWLLKDRNLRVRSLDPIYMKHVQDYFEQLFRRLESYQINYDGPIILMQVENEYGYFSNEKGYIKALVDLMKNLGVVVPIVTSDSTRPSILKAGSLPEEVTPTVNCGTNLKERLAHLKAYRPNGPWMTMEFWIGWFNVWGGQEEKRALEPILKDFDDMLSEGHINIYMAHGGTNFGFMNGANYYEKITDDKFSETYAPATTSYDYGAPISEDGSLKDSYYEFRKIIEKYRKHRLDPIDVPKTTKTKAYGTFKVKEKVSLFRTLDKIATPVYSDYPLTMEDVDQGYGYILYRSNLGPSDFEQRIKLIDVDDRAQVYLNEKHQWTAYRESFHEVKKIQLDNTVNNHLDILVENMGRTNFGPYLNDQRKGIKKAVMLDEYQQTGWEHFCLPLDNVEDIDFSAAYSSGTPAFYLVEFELEEIADTYLSLKGWGKGIAIMNDFHLGRFYEAGPQEKLYVPAPILKKGTNTLIIFETEGKATGEIELVSK